MRVVYMSRTGNVDGFVEELETVNPVQIEMGGETIDEDFLLITYSEDDGVIPDEIEEFLEEHADYLKAVAVSGDKAYGEDYCMTGKNIADTYGVEVILEFENEGTDEDLQIIQEYIK